MVRSPAERSLTNSSSFACVEEFFGGDRPQAAEPLHKKYSKDIEERFAWSLCWTYRCVPDVINNQFDTLAGFRWQGANDFFQIASTTNDDGEAFLNLGLQDCTESLKLMKQANCTDTWILDQQYALPLLLPTHAPCNFHERRSESSKVSRFNQHLKKCGISKHRVKANSRNSFQDNVENKPIYGVWHRAAAGRPPSWTAAALLPLSPSTACCGDFSPVPTINSQQQAAEIKAAAGLPQS